MRRRLKDYVYRFNRANVLVIGDVMLDHYIWGAVHRISPEAPVPVVQVEQESFRLGGAANVYNNIRSLGGTAELCGVIGRDGHGRQVIKALGLTDSRSGILIDSSRPTTLKARILAHSQQVVRYDIEKCHDLSPALTRRLLHYIARQLPHVSCLVISDYAKGVVTPSLMEGIGKIAQAQALPVIVDPKVVHLSYYAGTTVITPNHLEAQEAVGYSSRSGPHSIHEIGHLLRQKLGCEAVLVTRGEQGMSLCERDGSSWHIPAIAKQVYDVTGAGDTVVSTLALALSVGASLREGAILANHAAGIVVGQVGTAVVTQQQLQEALDHVPLE
ncbi:MAG: D-glycero-beta-D-manno-heptose-7-phosphate kinase [Nitrospirae bacterium]|nr:MAG: D-glycero-beta-D-manno-heptose-7-phosphate kinase [Nitrospirota bacterium]